MKRCESVCRMLVFFLILLNAFSLNAQKFENLAQTPPMGWNSWNKFACNVSEKLIKNIADAMVSSGMKDVGYTYIVIDDCWHGKRDSLGFIQPDAERFPSGIKALADYIHSKGLKFGIYSCAGDQTCGSKPGSRGYEYQDALQYAKWGVDYLKYDWCFTEGLKAVGAYTTMAKALVSAGHPIVFSLCEWGDNKPWDWGSKVGHLWRTTGDIYDCFDCVIDHGTWKSWGVMKILDMQDGLRKYAGPGHWNDPDMLEVGNGGMTVNEDRAHFSMWSMIAAPLIAGNDIATMSPETKAILTNTEVIAINQDALGIQGFKYNTRDSVETWFKPLKEGDWAVCFLNRSVKPQKIQFNWTAALVTDSINNLNMHPAQHSYKMVDVWTKIEIGTTQKTLLAEVPAHDVLMMRLTPIKIKDNNKK
jgi:alpha-galactosidase